MWHQKQQLAIGVCSWITSDMTRQLLRGRVAGRLEKVYGPKRSRWRRMSRGGKKCTANQQKTADINGCLYITSDVARRVKRVRAAGRFERVSWPRTGQNGASREQRVLYCNRGKTCTRCKLNKYMCSTALFDERSTKSTNANTIRKHYIVKAGVR